MNTATISAFATTPDGATVEVPVTVTLLRRLPSFTVIGPIRGRDTADRVISALRASGFEVPRMRIEVTIPAPPSGMRWPKPEGFDLPVALAVLAASGQARIGSDLAFDGELSLGGNVSSGGTLREVVSRVSR